MKILKINKERDSAVIKLAVEYLKKGKTVVYPTETFYGLGCDAANSKAVRKIYKIKGRDKNKALPFLVANKKMAKEYLLFNVQAEKLAREYWPGPLSLVLKLNKKGGQVFHCQNAGVRFSSNKIATKLVKKLGKPLISTSANLSGQPSAIEINQIIKYFKNRKDQPDLVLDAGKLPKSKGSTFIDLTKEEPILLRKGDIKLSFKSKFQSSNVKSNPKSK